MKDTVAVAAVQLVPRPLDRAANADAMARHVAHEVGALGADLVVFPELATTGYVPPACDDGFREGLWRESDEIPGATTEALGTAARASGTHVIVGLSERRGDRLRNSAVLIDPNGSVIGIQPKVHLWGQERHYFAAGDRFEVFTTRLGVIGMSVCYDSRFPESSRVQALRGAEILVCVFALAEEPGLPAGTLRQRSAVRAMENNAYYIACNRRGTEAVGEFFGSSTIAAPSGEVLTGEDALASVVRARLGGAELAAARRYTDLTADRRPDTYGDLLGLEPGS